MKKRASSPELRELIKEIKELYFEKEKYKSRNEKAIEYIKEYCIDDEFYINLTKKEKCIFDVLNILKGDDKEWKNIEN